MDNSRENIKNDYYQNWKLKNKKAISLKKTVKNIGGKELKDKKLAYLEAKKDIENLFGSLDYLDLTIPQYDAILDKIVCDKASLKFHQYKERENELKNAITIDVDGVIKKINKQLVEKIDEVKKLDKKLEIIGNESKASLKEVWKLRSVITEKEGFIYNQTLEINSLTYQLQESFVKNNKVNALLLEAIEDKEDDGKSQTQKQDNSYNSIDNYKKERTLFKLIEDNKLLSSRLLEHRQENSLLKKQITEAESQQIKGYKEFKVVLLLCGLLILYIILS